MTRRKARWRETRLDLDLLKDSELQWSKAHGHLPRQEKDSIKDAVTDDHHWVSANSLVIHENDILGDLSGNVEVPCPASPRGLYEEHDLRASHGVELV